MRQYSMLDFQPGQIAKHLSDQSCTMIIGLDIGHGETSACLYCNGLWEFLNLDVHGNQTIPSYISYQGDQVSVGYDVDMGRFYQHFKLPPTQWKEPLAGERTAKELLKDFADHVFWQIIGYNKKYDIRRAIRENSLLVVVSCPSSRVWMEADAEGEAYQNLIQDALGYQNVVTLSESYAAMIKELRSGCLDVPHGAAVFNLGSSAVDGVYVLPGKKLILRSKCLGGHQIDRGILLKAAADNDLQLTSLSGYQEAYLLTQVRALKEAYYLTGEPTEGMLYLTPEKTREYCRVRLTREWMQEVLTAEPVPCSDGQNAWCTELKIFFEEMHAAIGDRPCRAVVLTGGTSHVSEVMDVAQSVFGDIVKRADDPKEAVAVGLCHSKNRVETDFPAEDKGREYYRIYIQCLLKYVTEVEYRETLRIIEGSIQYPGDREIVKRLTPRLDQLWDSAGHIEWIREITERFTEVKRGYCIDKIDLGNRQITMISLSSWDVAYRYYEDDSFRDLAGAKLRGAAGVLYRHLMYHGNEETELQKLIYGPGGVRDYREAARENVVRNIKAEEYSLAILFAQHFTACVDPDLVSEQIKRICPPKLIAERGVIGDRRRGISGLWNKHRKKISLQDMLYQDIDLKNYFHAAAKTAYEMCLGQIFLLLFEEEVDLQ